MAAANPPLLAVAPEETFVGRRREIDQIYRLGLETAGARRHSTLLVGRRGIGKSEVLRRGYNLLFWNQSRVVPLCFTLTKETADAVAFARQYLATFLRQLIGFRRRDAALVNDEAMPHCRALRLAHEFNDPWLIQLVENFEESLRDEDWVSMLRNSIAAPLLTARMHGTPIFTIVDEFQRVGRLSLNGASVSLAGQYEFILQSSEAPHLIAGSTLRVIERILGSNVLGRHVERLHIEPLPERSALRLWEGLCRAQEVPFKNELGLEIVEQLEGVPLYIQALVRAASQQRVGLTSHRNVQMVYAHALLHGEIGAAWDAHFEEAVPAVADRRPALELLRVLNEDADLGPVEWKRLVRTVGLDEDRLQGLAERLERAGLLEIGTSQIIPVADRVVRDWVRLVHRREIAGEEAAALRQALVRERLLWTSRARQERAQRHLGLKVTSLLHQWDCQSTQPAMFDWPAFRQAHGGKLFQEILDAVEATPATHVLPQVVGVMPAAGAPPDAPTLLAYGFEEGRYALGQECLLVVQIHRTGTPVNATAAEEFLALSQRLAAPTEIERRHQWIVARGGFTEEAVELLQSAGCWTSDFTQLQLLLRQFGIHTEQAILGQATTLGFHEALTSGEYAVAIPMEADTELVAASAIDQIAAQAGFGEAARGQVKMAVIEACINAREHAGQSGTITLVVRPADTHLTIVVENPGLVFDSAVVTEPELEAKLGGAKSLRDKRGWGLKLMRTLMDEVVFEPCDEGTRVRLVKYRTPNAQTPPAPVINVSKE
jgi:anti-sigma regulatory factor (Ser/Thr protein kinase)